MIPNELLSDYVVRTFRGVSPNAEESYDETEWTVCICLTLGVWLVGVIATKLCYYWRTKSAGPTPPLFLYDCHSDFMPPPFRLDNNPSFLRTVFLDSPLSMLPAGFWN